MTDKGKLFLTKARAALTIESTAVLQHPFVLDAGTGTLPIEALRVWCRQQYPILRYDTCSIAHMYTRSRHVSEKQFFSMLLSGAQGAETLLEACANELGISTENLNSSTLLPWTQAYGHFIAWLALYGNPGEQAAAFTVNLPTYARVMARLGEATKAQYGLTGGGFFDLWSLGLDYGDDPADAVAPPEWESLAVEICGRYVDRYENEMLAACRMLQTYELAFWDSNYSTATGQNM